MTSIARSITKFSKNEIKLLFENAEKHSICSAFVLLRAQQQTIKGRILIVSSKKVGTAPVRNLLKRRIKHIFLHQKLYGKGFDWILITRRKATFFTFLDLQKKLTSCFSLD